MPTRFQAKKDLIGIGLEPEIVKYLLNYLVLPELEDEFNLAELLNDFIPDGATQTIIGSEDLEEILFMCPEGEAFRVNSAGDLQHSQTDFFISGIREEDDQATVILGGHTYGLGHTASIIVGGRHHGHAGQIIIMGGGGGAANAVMIATGDGTYINPSNGHVDGLTRLTFRDNGDYAWRGDPQYFFAEGGTDANAKSFYLCGGQSGSITDGAIMFVSGKTEETLLGTCGFLGANVATGHIKNVLGHTSALWKVIDTGGGEMLTISDAAKISLIATMTAAGQTGAKTINRPVGSVNLAAGASSLVVTNSLVTTSSMILPSILTNDATAKTVTAEPGSGSFTLRTNANATAETRIGFLVLN